MHLDYLQKIAVFVRVAQHLNFSTAAAELGLSTGTVSRQIARLEREIGVQLLIRNTRNVSLTEIGQQFYRRSNHLLSLAEESLAEIQDLDAEPRGTLRVTAPALFGVKHLGPIVTHFTQRYPKVHVRLSISDDLEKVSNGDFDVAVRITNHLDDGVIAKKLTSIKWVVCASPDYIRKHGAPETPADLKEHQCCHYPSMIKQDRWSFVRDKAEYEAPIHSRLQVNSSQIIAGHVLAGQGIAMLPTYLIGEHLKSEELIPLLTAYQPKINSALYAIYSPTRYLTAKVRHFLDLLTSSFADPPYWEYETRL